MKVLLLALALVAIPAAAQEKKAPPDRKAAKKMPVAKAHSKPSPEQVRRFNDLQKKNAK